MAMAVDGDADMFDETVWVAFSQLVERCCGNKDGGGDQKSKLLLFWHGGTLQVYHRLGCDD